MRIARGLDVEDLGDGGFRVRAVDWPSASWFAWPALAAGAVLVLWCVRVAWTSRTFHWVEFGGGLVFAAFGYGCAWLAYSHQRDFEVFEGLDGVSISGFRGAGIWRRVVAQDLASPVRIEIRAFGVPVGAPDLDDRGGELLLVAKDAEIVLARRYGKGWGERLAAARARLVQQIPLLGG